MGKLFILFISIFTVVQLYGQQYVRETYPTVRFKCVDNRSDSVVIVREELPVHFELYYDGKRAGLLSPSVYWDNPDLEFGYGNPKNDPKTKSAQAWEAWLCTRVIPREVKDKLNLSSRKEDNEISYLTVFYELQIMVRFDKNEKIIQVDFFFQNRDLYQSVTEDQLMMMYKGIMKNCRLIEGIYRLPMKGVEAKEFEPAETYILELSPNSSLRWIKECQEYHPKVWNAAVEYFDSLEQVK
jgi:hypothetical protein